MSAGKGVPESKDRGDGGAAKPGGGLQTGDSHMMSDTGEALFLFQLGAARVAIPAHAIDSVLPASPPTPIPTTPGYVLGLIPYGETTLPVIDPTRFLQLEEEGAESGSDVSARRIIVVRSADMLVGLKCERALGVVRVEKQAQRLASVLSGGRIKDFLKAEFETPEARVGILDIDGLLDAARIRGGESAG